MPNNKYISSWKMGMVAIKLFISMSFLMLRLDINAIQTLPEPPISGSILQDNSGIEMVYVPPAEYLVGVDKVTLERICIQRGYTAPRDLKNCVDFTEIDTGATFTETIKISGFWIDRYEVTIHHYQEGCRYWGKLIDPCDNKILNGYPLLTQNPEQPILGIDWYTAQRFCNDRGARLPTEAEWEYAASGVEKMAYPWGDGFISDFVHHPDDTYPSTQTYPVGSVSQNKSWIGVYDMSGNAAEWVEDYYIGRAQRAYFDASEKLPHYYQIDLARVIKGGSWDGRPWPMLTFYREYNSPMSLNPYVGFRCAKNFWVD